MGAYLSEPVTTKESEDGDGNRLRFGACCMQGWRVSQEDAHNCLPNFDKDGSFFAVYDGHGGAEVAIYLSRHFPEILKNCEAYKNGNWEEALRESYLKIDASIPTKSVLVELQKIARQQSGDKKGESVTDYEEENVNALYEEATMPLDKLVALYQHKTGEDGNASSNEIEIDKPCSSKTAQSPSPSKCVLDKPEVSPKVNCSINAADIVGSTNNSNAPSTAINNSAHNDSPSSTTASSNNIPTVTNEKLHSPIKKDNEDAEKFKEETPNMDVNEKCEEKKDATTLANGSSSNHKENDEIIVKNEEVVKKDELTLKNEEIVVKKDEILVNNDEVVVKKDVIKSAEEPTQNGVCDTDGENKVTNVQIENGTAASPVKARKAKVHPPLVSPQKDEPKKMTTRNRSLDANIYSVLKKAILNNSSDSDSSESEDYIAGLSDSEDDDEDASSAANSSSTENAEEVVNDEGVEDEDDDDDDDADEEDDDDQFLSDIQEPGFDSGSTAVVAFMKWEGDKLGLWVGNAGDSRCVVCRKGKAIEMSVDHKPEEQNETRRIVAAGGKVTHDGRVNGGLNLSRAIGDHSYKQNPKMSPEEQMITPLPDIQHIVLDPETDEFIVMACDGIWNSMSSQEVVDFVSAGLKKNEKVSTVCEKIFDACLSTDTSGDGTGCDNMTAIIINLSKPSTGIQKRRLSNPEENKQEESKKPKLETDV